MWPQEEPCKIQDSVHFFYRKDKGVVQTFFFFFNFLVQTFWHLSTAPETLYTVVSPISCHSPGMQWLTIPHTAQMCGGMLVSLHGCPSYPFCLEKPPRFPHSARSSTNALSFLILYSVLVVPYSTSNILITEHCYG